MKFTKEHFGILQTRINEVLDNNPEIAAMYESGNFPRSDKVKDLQRRFCFDLFWATGLVIGDGVGIKGDIQGDYTDEHLYTVLKRVCPKVTRKY